MNPVKGGVFFWHSQNLCKSTGLRYSPIWAACNHSLMILVYLFTFSPTNFVEPVLFQGHGLHLRSSWPSPMTMFLSEDPFCVHGVLICEYIFSVMLDDFGSAHYFSTFMCILYKYYKIMYLEHLFAKDCSNLLLWASHCSDTMNSGACASGSVTRYLGTETWGNMIWTSTFLGDSV